MPRARALCKTPAKKRFIWQRSTLPLTNFVSQPCFNMDTSNKIRVVDRDTFRMTRTYSGGVRDPSDPKHYPTLVGTEGAVGASAAKRTLSTPGSFKETLLVRHDHPKLRIGTQLLPGASPSISPTELQRTSSRTADRADEPATASQTIPAHRSVEGDEPVQGGVGGAGGAGLSIPSQQVS